ncbi:ankyrin repeat domain-containing protein [Wolbachia endosymbiont (group A) of Pipizella viduata]
MYCSSKESLLDMAAVNRNPKILRTLLDKGADINVQVETALRGT